MSFCSASQGVSWFCFVGCFDRVVILPVHFELEVRAKTQWPQALAIGLWAHWPLAHWDMGPSKAWYCTGGNTRGWTQPWPMARTSDPS